MATTTHPSAALSHNHIHVTAALRTQIKTRDRVRDLAEVYTHEREVNAMLDLVADMFPTEGDPGNHDRSSSNQPAAPAISSKKSSAGSSPPPPPPSAGTVTPTGTNTASSGAS